MWSGRIRNASVKYDWRSLECLNGTVPRGIEFVGLLLLEKYKPGDCEVSIMA